LTEPYDSCRLFRYVALLISAPLVALAFPLASAPAQAHHSFAMYDRTATETLTGRLTRFIPGANHAQLIFEVLGPDGETVLGDDGAPLIWGFETARAATLAQLGVTVRSFPVGTIIKVSVNPLRDGRPFGVLSGGIIRCGSDWPAGGCTAETGELFMMPSPD
jgi:hypothetical protein